ncbi:SPOR domain-containing protein [Sphingomonas sp. PR090111-T3T-6A]|uniref:SPOR domain-containing protein n=1 Tax=Sphingomonas sp. PR090111-T3T-6A TaxID=685778 RepID=UPI00037E4FE8|nr:SPOR domain-containing protein [Sphingomonas sp. PR090111-T3T-6A]
MRTPAAVMLALSIGTPAAAASVKDGVDAWQHGRFTDAVAVWQPLAKAGDADAAFDLGQAYKLGRGVPADLAKARELFRQGAKAGHAESAANYGLLLFQNNQCAAAMPWIMQASEAGDPRAQYVYATALFNGDFVPRNWPKAYALMSRAAAAGLPQATTNLAIIDETISEDERRKGIGMAQQIASLPLPPINRSLITSLPTQGLASSSLDTPPTPALVARSTPTLARPSPPPHPAPRPAVPALPASIGGRWQVQLGAYGSEAGAKAAWAGLHDKAASLRRLSPSYEKAGALTRLRVGPLADRAATEQACAAARAAGAACFAIAP